jgi:DNA polymerase IV
MEKLINLPFNPKQPTLMHVDINSCFATIEQQANPKLRGKPVAIAAYSTPNGCILAASVEAKRLGIKTGMCVKEGKFIYRDLIVLEPDPWKYRDVHLKLRKLLRTYTEDLVPKSIDEFVMNLEGYPAFKMGMRAIGRDIQQKIKTTIGEWIMVSIGVGPNRFLAKTAAGLHKPNGLDEINSSNFLEIYRGLALLDLCGIKQRNSARLGSVGIYSVLDFYDTPIPRLISAFHSIVGYYWYLRLHGWEIDDVGFGRHSYGNSYALPKPFKTLEELSPILYKLVEKTGRRLRNGGYRARGVHVAVSYRDGTYWHHGHVLGKEVFDSRDIYKEAYRILCGSPYKTPVAILAESCFDLVNINTVQTHLFDDVWKKESLVSSLDKITEKWGEFVITPAKMLGTCGYVPDRIAFGGIKELEEFTFS